MNGMVTHLAEQLLPLMTTRGSAHSQLYGTAMEVGAQHHAMLFVEEPYGIIQGFIPLLAAGILYNNSRAGLRPGDLLTIHGTGKKRTIRLQDLAPALEFAHSTHHQRRIVFIRDADRMGREAEARFLKTLEEPASPLLFLLSTSRPSQLAATIRSRVVEVAIPRTLSDSVTASEDLASLPQVMKRPLLVAGFAKDPETAHLLETFAELLPLLHSESNVQRLKGYGVLLSWHEKQYPRWSDDHCIHPYALLTYLLEATIEQKAKAHTMEHDAQKLLRQAERVRLFHNDLERGMGMKIAALDFLFGHDLPLL